MSLEEQNYYYGTMPLESDDDKSTMPLSSDDLFSSTLIPESQIGYLQESFNSQKQAVLLDSVKGYKSIANEIGGDFKEKMETKFEQHYSKYA